MTSEPSLIDQFNFSISATIYKAPSLKRGISLLHKFLSDHISGIDLVFIKWQTEDSIWKVLDGSNKSLESDVLQILSDYPPRQPDIEALSLRLAVLKPTLKVVFIPHHKSPCWWIYSVFNDQLQPLLYYITGFIVAYTEKQLHVEKLKLEEKVNRLSQIKLESLHEIGLSINSELKISNLVEDITVRAVAALDASAGLLLLTQQKTPILHPSYAVNVDEKRLKRTMLTQNNSFFTRMANEKQGLLLNADNAAILLKLLPHQYFIGVPIYSRQKQNLHGFIILADKEDRNGVAPFDTDDLEFLSAFASHAGIALHNALLHQETIHVKNFNQSVLDSIPSAVVTMNEFGEVTTYNQSFVTLFSLPEADVIGHHYEVVFSTNKAIQNVVKKADLLKQKVSERDVHAPHISADAMFNIHAAPLTDEHGLHVGLVLMVDDLSRENKVKSIFKRYVASSLVEQLMTDETKLKLGGERREVVMLFSDIRGFTAMSEAMEPEEVVNTLNDYFSIMIDIIFKNKGTLDKIVGDELMVVFGAPIAYPDDVERAVKTAIEMMGALLELNRRRVQHGQPGLHMGIGINVGEVVSGNIGSPDRMDYTVIGDAVNLAARLCSAAKAEEIIISKSVYERLPSGFNVDVLQPISVKGKAKPIEIFKVE